MWGVYKTNLSLLLLIVWVGVGGDGALTARASKGEDFSDFNIGHQLTTNNADEAGG